MTNATYTKPRHVATYVKSETQSGLGRSAENCRCTRAAAAVSGRVMIARCPRTTPCSPDARVNHSTVHRATAIPSRCS